MPGTIITTDQINNMSETMIGPALLTREHSPMMTQLFRTVRLRNGVGLTYNEPYLGAITASTLTDGVEFDSPSAFSDTNVQITAGEYGVQTLVSLLTNDQVRENLLRIAGRLMANSMEYLRDRQGILEMDSAGCSVGSGTATPVVGHITAASANIRAGLPGSGGVARTGARDTGDPADSPIYCVLHEYQWRALAAQVSGLFSGASDGAIATTAATQNFGVNRGSLAPWQVRWLEAHFRTTTFDGVKVLVNNNIGITSNAAKGGVFERDSTIHLKYRTPNHYTVRERDGRAVRITYSENWGFGETKDVGKNELNLAAPVPTT